MTGQPTTPLTHTPPFIKGLLTIGFLRVAMFKRTAMFPDPRLQQGFKAPITLMASQPTAPGRVPPAEIRLQ